MKNNQKGLTHILILVASLGLITFILISSSAVFKDRLFSILFPKPQSRAISPPIVFKSSSGEILPNNSFGIPLTTSSTVKIELTSTLGSPQASPSATPVATSSASEASSGSGIDDSVIVYTYLYKFAENSQDLEKASYLDYTQEPTIVDYTFKDSSLGSKFIWVEFKDSLGATDVKSAQIELISAQTTPTPSPSPTPTPTPSPTPTPTPTPTPRPSLSPTRTPSPSPTPIKTPIPAPNPTFTPAKSLTPSPKPTFKTPVPEGRNTFLRPTYEINFVKPSPSPELSEQEKSKSFVKPCDILCNINKIIEGINKVLEQTVKRMLINLGLLPKQIEQVK